MHSLQGLFLKLRVDHLDPIINVFDGLLRKGVVGEAMDWFFVEWSAKRTSKCPGGVPSGAVELFFDGELNLGRTLLDFFMLVLLDFLVLVVDTPLHDQRLLGA